MKRRSLLALLMVVILCMTMAMTGCKKDEAKNPVEEITLEKASENTMKALFDTDCSLGVFENMDEKKTVTVALGEMFTNVLNLDLPNKSFYDQLTLTEQGQSVDFNVYCNGTDLAFSAPALLGSDQAMGVNLTTLVEDLLSSSLMDGSMEGSAEVAGILKLLTEHKDAFMGVLDYLNPNGEKLQKFIQDVNAVANSKAATKEEGVANINGEEVKAVIFTQTMDQEDIKKVTDITMGYYEDVFNEIMAIAIEAGMVPADILETEENPFNEIHTQMEAAFGNMKSTSTTKTYVNPDNQCIMSVETTNTTTVDETKADVTTVLVFGKDPTNSDQISMNLTSTSDGSKVTVDAVASTSTAGAVDTSKLEVTVDMDGEKNNVVITNTYDRDSHGYKLTAAVDGDELVLSGKLENTDDKLAVTLDELTAEGQTQQIGLSVTVENTPDCEIPAVPEYINVLTDMDLGALLGAGSEDYTEYPEEDWEDLEGWEDMEDWEDWEDGELAG